MCKAGYKIYKKKDYVPIKFYKGITKEFFKWVGITLFMFTL